MSVLCVYKGSMGRPWGDLVDPGGSWGDPGGTLGGPWPFWGDPGGPWGALGPMVGSLGMWTNFGTALSEQMLLNHHACAQKQASRSSVPDPADPADPPDPPDPAETQHPVRNRPWVPHAGGQDYGSLHKLPQITLCNSYHIIQQLLLNSYYICNNYYSYYIM